MLGSARTPYRESPILYFSPKLNVIIENAQKGKRNKVSQSGAIGMIERRLAVATVQIDGVIARIKLVEPPQTDQYSGLFYDRAARTGQITQQQAKGVPFAGDIRKLGLACGPSNFRRF